MGALLSFVAAPLALLVSRTVRAHADAPRHGAATRAKHTVNDASDEGSPRRARDLVKQIIADAEGFTFGE